MQLINAFTEPAKLFDELRQKPSFAVPLVLMIVMAVLVTYAYYARVDGEWMIEHMANAAGTPAEQKMIRDGMSVDMMKWPSLIAAPIVLVIMYLLSAVYYTLAGKVCGVEGRFSQWFSFSCWSTVPALLGLLIALIQVAIMPAQTLWSDVYLTHLDPLFGVLPLNHPWKGFMTSVDLLMVWSIGLGAVGWRQWSQGGWAQAIIVASLPSVVIFGIWATVVAVMN
ncbi:YIP1 family protein [Chitinimonas sp. BJYL2]|uniref:YIP1 family protein n=1 Tax=Chitinimonas sp. BJYL2 TaxID=2976696 RepID=UPI0022B37148|nr:YIP1 family protein [Chitinimonas sp. BJYL2]